MRVFKLILIILTFFFLQSIKAGGASDILHYYRSKLNRNLEREACMLARKAIETYIREKRMMSPPPDFPPALWRPAGVFVTSVRNGKVRSCMGTLEPRESNAAREIIRSAVLSATADPWNPQIQMHELKDLQFIISITGPLRRVDTPSRLNPARYGLLVRRGTRSALLLPGEALTAEWQIYQCKKKAGIPQNEPVEMFIFETITLGPY